MSNSISNGGAAYPPDSLIAPEHRAEETKATTKPSLPDQTAAIPNDAASSSGSGLLSALGGAPTELLNNAAEYDAVQGAVHELINDPATFFQTLAASLGDLPNA